MIDFVDPVLRSSPQSKTIRRKYSFKNFSLIIFIIIAIAGLGWLIYVGNTATLNTVPERTIEVSDQIENKKFENRIDPIQTKPNNQ